MSRFAIRTEGLGKRYHIGGPIEPYETLRDKLANALFSPFVRVGNLLRGRSDRAAGFKGTFWALKDISLEVKPGELVGVIGRNGAGKSTLLKILSRITDPTEGRVKIRGRVGALLEVGTGFHAELTGRENIYLNSVILGMKKSEIDRKFDQIVAFAEVDKFIDTPMKRYSTGMYLRLAFAVAAHLDPDILLVDEVLAVGDASFQKKCLKKMERVGDLGRTVFFVSHNMQAITRLCDRAILLEEGRITHDGPAHQVVSAYLSSGLGSTAVREWEDPSRAPGNEVVRLRSVRVKMLDGATTDAIDIQKPFEIEMTYKVRKPEYILVPSFQLYNEEGVHLFTTFDLDPAWRRRPRPPGHYVSTVRIPGNLLAEGMITVSSVVNTFTPPIVHVREPDSVVFHIIDNVDGNSARGDFAGRMRGVMRPLLEWRTEEYQETELKVATSKKY